MIIWFKKLRYCIDFAAREYWAERKCPPEAIAVDVVTVEPGCTVTRVEAMILHQRGATVLHLSAYDAVWLVTLLGTLGILRPKLTRRLLSLFASDPVPGLATIARAALPYLPAPGEHGARVAQQVASRPADWAALRAEALSDYADRCGTPEAAARAAQARLALSMGAAL